MNNYLVFDWGGTFLKYAVVDKKANIIEKDKVPTPQPTDNNEADRKDFFNVIDDIVAGYKESVDGIAISMPGMIDISRGYTMTAGWLKYLTGMYLVDYMSTRYGLRVAVQNDGKCAALAEYWKGSLSDVKNGAVMVLGTAVGGGIIINGQLYSGRHFSAGEYSFMFLDAHNRGVFESTWGNYGAKGLIREVCEITGDNPEILDGIELFKRADDGEEGVLKGLKNYTDILAVSLYNLNVLLDLDKIAVGGGISQQPLLMEYIKNSIDEFDCYNPLRKYDDYIPKPNVVVTKFNNDANLIGALYNYNSIYKEFGRFRKK
ncbi:MAG: ROK family protein [Lachnospiraceae bacterium]|nr:ROK family protein [Lachnospiraceae bacterium]MBQ9232797.1 ROK family protein [Lachnospiraceae bacterium]